MRRPEAEYLPPPVHGDGPVLGAGDHEAGREVDTPEDVGGGGDHGGQRHLRLPGGAGGGDPEDEQLTVVVAAEEVGGGGVSGHQADAVHGAVAAAVQPPARRKILNGKLNQSLKYVFILAIQMSVLSSYALVACIKRWKKHHKQ